MPQSTNQNSTASYDPFAGRDEGSDEHTPLIPRTPFGSGLPRSWRSSMPRLGYLKADSDEEDDPDAVDVDELRLNVSRVGSLGVGTGLEPARPQYYQSSVAVQRPARPSKAISQLEDGTPSPKLRPVDAPAQQTEEEDDGEDEEEESRFIGITPGRFWLIFSVVMLGYFIACFDSTLMASSHPVITSYFKASQAASWLSTVFLITSTAFQPLFGRVSDTIGRKPVFLASFFLFGATTLWCALAQSIESFIAARAVCGLGAGGTMSMSLIIVSDLVRIEERGVFQSHINFAFGTGSAVGAALGGYLCDTLGWRWAFGVQVPFLAACFIAAMFVTPSRLGPMLINDKEDGEGSWAALKKFDTSGSMLLLVSVTFLILALNLGGNIFPWLSPMVIASIIIFVVTSVLFCWAELIAKQPVMPLRLLTRPPIANMVFANFLGGIATNTVLFNVPLFFQAVLLTSASSSGFRLAVPSLVGSAAGISTGYIITYTRKLKPTLLLGAIVYVIGSAAICFMDKNVSEALSLVLITGVPLGQGFVFPNTMMSALAVSPPKDQAVVTTTIGLWRSLGVVMGVAVSSLVFQNTLFTKLELLVQGSEKHAVIRAVRSSVKSIKFLDMPYQGQVIDAYAQSLRITFVCAVIASVAMLVIVAPIKLPTLKKGKKRLVPAGE